MYRGLYKACYGGHKDVVEYMFIHGIPDANSGMYYACEGGQLHIVELMISKGATRYNDGLKYACSGSQIEAVKLMIQKLKQNNQKIFLEWGLCEVCRELKKYGSNVKDCVEIIKLLINEGVLECTHCHKSISEHLRLCSLPDYGKMEHEGMMQNLIRNSYISASSTDF